MNEISVVRFLFTLVVDNKNKFCLITLHTTSKQTFLALCQDKEKKRRKK